MSLWSEIHEQPDVIARAMTENADAVLEIASAMKEADVSHVIIAARGTSDNAARYAKYLFGLQNRLIVALAAPSLYSAYRSPPSMEGALVIGISQSGQSPDLVEVLAEGSRQGRPTLAITNDPESPLATTADWVLPVRAGVEEAVAATKTYTAQLLAVAMLSVAFAGHDRPPEPLLQVPGWMRLALSNNARIAEIADQLAGQDRLVVVGRGLHQSTAFEWALKLQELTYLLAQPYSEADFRHGPFAVVEAGFPVLAVTTRGAVAPMMAKLCADLTERAARVIAITDQPDLSAADILPVPECPEWVSPMVAIVVGQLFAYHLTVARGLDPDRPRGLSKVTKTR